METECEHLAGGTTPSDCHGGGADENAGHLRSPPRLRNSDNSLSE